MGKIAGCMFMVVVSAFVSPFKKDRELVRCLFPHGEFFEIYCAAAVDVCEGRDVKGHYKMAREGKIKNFTGISAPYEEPVNPEIAVDTGSQSLETCVDEVIELLESRGIINHS